ncbi:rhodanese-like domain-containing protein [bacterium]|nr:rhodanese-like domain-containing protein [bacterium]
METTQTTGCGCQSNSTVAVDTETNVNQKVDQGVRDTSCSCGAFHDPKVLKSIERFLKYPEGHQIENGVYENISPKETYELIKKHEKDPDFAVLDVRTKNEFDNSRIPNSILLDVFSSSFKDTLNCFDRNRTYVVFCTIGGRSGLVMDLMKKMGFGEVYNVVGGEERWIMEELPYGYPQNPAEWSNLPISS